MSVRSGAGPDIRDTTLAFFIVEIYQGKEMKSAKQGKDALKTIGKRLKLWRKNKRMKATQLAESIKISQSSLSEIENGKNLPSAQTITNLMKLEGMDIFWLLTGEESSDVDFLKVKERVSR